MSRNSVKLFAPILLLLLLLTAACSDGSADKSPPQSSANASSAGSNQASGDTPQVQAPLAEKLQVVTTSTIVGDWVRAVGQDRVALHSLLPTDADAHTYQPGARDIARIADADMVMSIGLSLEARWLDKLITNAAQDPDRVVALGDAVDPLASMEDEFDGHGKDELDGGEDRNEGKVVEGEEADHGKFDPHFWFDPLRVKQAVNSIAAHLSTVDPTGQTSYRENAAAYNRALDDLDDWIQEQVATLPDERRLLVTSHDSFQYFAVRYGFEVVGAIFPLTTEAEPTAQELSGLIETIEHGDAPAVFTEKSHSDRLARRIAEETGADLIGGLYTGSLSESEGAAGTYLDLMKYNTKTIVEALR